MRKCVRWWKYKVSSTDNWMGRMRPSTRALSLKFVCEGGQCIDVHGYDYRGSPECYEDGSLMWHVNGEFECFLCGSGCQWGTVDATVLCDNNDWLTDDILTLFCHDIDTKMIDD